MKKDKMLGTEKIGILLAKLSIPGTIAMLITALYNLVDAIFVGRGVGTGAIGGLAIAFPFQMLIMAMGGFLGFGAASVVSRNLGSGNRDRAYTAAGNVLFLSIIIGIAITVLGSIYLDSLLKLFGATETLIAFSREYLSVILLGTTFITFALTGNNIVRSEGRATVAMVSMLIGAGMNIILDPIFIFVFNMGIRGAALATVLSQGLSFLFLMVFFFSGRSSLRIKLSHLVPRLRILKEVFALGVPAFVRQAGMSIIGLIVNNSLGRYGGDLAISAYGIITRLMMFGLMPLFGVAQGFQPILFQTNLGLHIV